jgi:hypothetical protein
MTENADIRTLRVEEIDAVQGGARAADLPTVGGTPAYPLGVVIAIIAILIG